MGGAIRCVLLGMPRCCGEVMSVTNANLEPVSALSREEWEELETALFVDAGPVLQDLRECARGHGVQLVAFVLTAVQYVLACTPGRAVFDSGLGHGSLNLFTVLLGEPGAGKDRLMRTVSTCLNVTCNGQKLEPVPLALGSGEGVLETLIPEEGAPWPKPVLFGESEVGNLHVLLSRKGSTLRGRLLNIYSGNSMGNSTKGNVLTVPANSYRACLWVAAQPEMAHLLTDGEDDGFRHRFVWVEMIDPLRYSELPDKALERVDIDIPSSVHGGVSIDVPLEIKQLTWKASHKLAAYGIAEENSGHRNQTRLKLAAGFALIEGRGTIDAKDWARAGILMDYSDKVQARAMSFAKDRRVEEQVERLELKEKADQRRYETNVDKGRAAIVAALSDHDGVLWSAVSQRVNGRYRKYYAEARDELHRQHVIAIEQSDTGGMRLYRSMNFPTG